MKFALIVSLHGKTKSYFLMPPEGKEEKKTISSYITLKLAVIASGLRIEEKRSPP